MLGPSQQMTEEQQHIATLAELNQSTSKGHEILSQVLYTYVDTPAELNQSNSKGHEILSQVEYT